MPLDIPTQISDTVNVETFGQLKGPIAIQFSDEGKLIISISMKDGKVTFGDGITPDKAAQQFWDMITRLYPSVCKQKLDDGQK